MNSMIRGGFGGSGLYSTEGPIGNEVFDGIISVRNNLEEAEKVEGNLEALKDKQVRDPVMDKRALVDFISDVDVCKCSCKLYRSLLSLR